MLVGLDGSNALRPQGRGGHARSPGDPALPTAHG